MTRREKRKHLLESVCVYKQTILPKVNKKEKVFELTEGKTVENHIQKRKWKMVDTIYKKQKR